MNELFRISKYTTMKEIWDTLVETHEGTTEVKRNLFPLLKKKVDTMQKDFDKEKEKNFEKEKQRTTCKECESLSFQIVQLKRVLERYEKGKVGLDDLLSRQRYANDKSGLGYSTNYKPSSSQTIFVKASD